MDMLEQEKKRRKLQVTGLTLIIIALVVVTCYAFYIKEEYANLSEMYCDYTHLLSDAIILLEEEASDKNKELIDLIGEDLYPNCPSDYGLIKKRFDDEG